MHDVIDGSEMIQIHANSSICFHRPTNIPSAVLLVLVACLVRCLHNYHAIKKEMWEVCKGSKSCLSRGE
jgi:hypothetical protein